MLSLRRNDFDSYTDPMYGFSLRIPKGFLVSNLPEDQGEVIIAEHPSLNLGFEVFIAPFDADGPLTVNTIRELNPSLSIREPVDIELEDGTAALRFASEDPRVGETRQIWFRRGGNLFQVIMYSDNIEWLDPWVREMPGDWSFSTAQSDLAEPI